MNPIRVVLLVPIVRYRTSTLSVANKNLDLQSYLHIKFVGKNESLTLLARKIPTKSVLLLILCRENVRFSLLLTTLQMPITTQAHALNEMSTSSAQQLTSSSNKKARSSVAAAPPRTTRIDSLF